MLNNALYIIIIAVLCYTLYSYIQSYHKIIDELTKIRIKCINNQQKEEIENENMNRHNEHFKTEIKQKNNNDKNQNNKEEINQENDNNVFINFQKLSNIDNDNYKKDMINIENDIINTSSNDDTDKDFIQNINIKSEINENKIIKKLKNEIDVETQQEEFEKEKEIDYWSPYKEKHENITEGFVSSPYKGFNQNLYENLIIDSNTITNQKNHGGYTNNQAKLKNKDKEYYYQTSSQNGWIQFKNNHQTQYQDTIETEKLDNIINQKQKPKWYLINQEENKYYPIYQS